MVKQKKKKVGRPKKAPTKIVRVLKKKPDFETLVDSGYDYDLGFISGCNYVWDKYISKIKTIHPMP